MRHAVSRKQMHDALAVGVTLGVWHGKGTSDWMELFLPIAMCFPTHQCGSACSQRTVGSTSRLDPAVGL